jgi:hypothetical protein
MLCGLRGHKASVEFFQKFVGPFFAVSGSVVRVATGIAEVLTGLILFSCLWVDQLYWKFDRQSTVNNAKAWCLCMSVTIFFIIGIQAVMTFQLNQKLVSFASLLTGLNLLVLVLRLFACPPWSLPPSGQWLVWWYCALIPLPFLAAAWRHSKYGLSLNEIQRRQSQDDFEVARARVAASRGP